MNSYARPEIEKFRKLLLENLPPIIARKDVDRLLGGTICAKTLANLDSLGEGPKDTYKVGKNVVYSTASLVDWLINSLGVKVVHNDLELLLIGRR